MGSNHRRADLPFLVCVAILWSLIWYSKLGTIQGKGWPESHKDALSLLSFRNGKNTILEMGKNNTIIKYHIWSKQEVLLSKYVKSLPQDMMKLFNIWLTSRDIINLHMEGLLELMTLYWMIARAHFCTSQHSSVPRSERFDYTSQFSWAPSSKLYCCPVTVT